MKDNNMAIRKYFNKIYKMFASSCPQPFQKEKIDEYTTLCLIDYFLVLHNLEKSAKYQNTITSLYRVGDEEYCANFFRIELIELVIVQDLYIFLKEKEKFEGLNDEEQSIFDILKECISENNFKKLMSDKKTIKTIISPSFKMINASALIKVELYKSLSNEDIELLESINPFFKEEYDHYNISITKEFLNKHLGIWEAKEGYESAITKVTDFLIRVFNTNLEEGEKIAYTISNGEDEANDLLIYLNNKEFDYIAPIVRNFYDNNKTEANQLN